MTTALRRSVFLWKVWLLVAFIRVGLWVLPFALVRRLASRCGRRISAPRAQRQRRPEVLVGAVRRAACYVPGASCLTQALAAEVLLLRAGHTPRLRIGLRRDDAGAIRAHAWVENRGHSVAGDVEVEPFIPLPALERP